MCVVSWHKCVHVCSVIVQCVHVCSVIVQCVLVCSLGTSVHMCVGGRNECGLYRVI